MENLSVPQILELSEAIVALEAAEEPASLLDRFEAGQNDYAETLLRLRELPSRSRVSDE